MSRLDGQVVVVTGGSRGIGRAIVLGAVRRGARVVFCSRTDEGHGTTCDAARELGGEVVAVTGDVSREDDVDAVFDAAIDAFQRVDVAVNNAGINQDDLLVRSPVEVFDRVIATNLTGAFLVARRAVLEFLAQGTGGRIISVGSISQQGATSQAVYAASKGGLLGLTRTLAKEYGSRGITANVVVAGWVETALSDRLSSDLRAALVERTPLRRAGAADEVASAVLWLASREAGFVNGAELHAAGGLREVPL